MNLKPPTDIVIYSIENAITSYRKFTGNNIKKVESNITVDQALKGPSTSELKLLDSL